MCLGRVANMVLIYSYVEANRNSQTGVTGPVLCYRNMLCHGLSVCSKRFHMYIDLKHF